MIHARNMNTVHESIRSTAAGAVVSPVGSVEPETVGDISAFRVRPTFRGPTALFRADAAGFLIQYAAAFVYLLVRSPTGWYLAGAIA